MQCASSVSACSTGTFVGFTVNGRIVRRVEGGGATDFGAVVGNVVGLLAFEICEDGMGGTAFSCKPEDEPDAKPEDAPEVGGFGSVTATIIVTSTKAFPQRVSGRFISKTQLTKEVSNSSFTSGWKPNRWINQI